MKNQISNQQDKASYSKAKEMITQYQEVHQQDSDYLASEYFDVDMLRNLISNPDCKGLRIYNAIKEEDGKKQNRFIIMAEDENGKTILNYKTQFAAVSVNALGAGMSFIEPITGIVENGRPCPPSCN